MQQARLHVPVGIVNIDRFVLTDSLPGNNSGWNIYPTSGTTRVRAYVPGQQLVMITPSGTRAVN